MSFRGMRKTPSTSTPGPSGKTPSELAAELRAQAAALETAPVHDATVAPETAPAATATATAVVTPAKTGAANALSTALAALGIVPAVATGIKALAAVAAEGVSSQLFPAIVLASGNTGGSFVPMNGMPAEIMPKLPTGREIKAMFLSYRYVVTGWATDFESRAPGEKADKPVYSAVIPNSDAATVELLGRACRKYQYTAKAARGAKYDFDTTNIGHVRSCLEILVWSPVLGDLLVVQSPAYYTSVEKTGESIDKHVNPATNAIDPFPMTLRAVTDTTANKSGSHSWKVHHMDLGGEPNAVGAALVKQFGEWLAVASTSPEAVADFQKWTTGGDAPLTDQVRDALRLAAAL